MKSILFPYLINRFEMIHALLRNIIKILNRTRCENFCKARNRIHRVNQPKRNDRTVIAPLNQTRPNTRYVCGQSLFSLALRLTPNSLKLESLQESPRCRPMRFGILEPLQATFEQFSEAGRSKKEGKRQRRIKKGTGDREGRVGGTEKESSSIKKFLSCEKNIVIIIFC